MKSCLWACRNYIGWKQSKAAKVCGHLFCWRVTMNYPLLCRLLSLVLAVSFAFNTAAADELLLVCAGVGQKKAFNSSSIFMQDNQGNFVTGNVWGSGGVISTDEMVKVKIDGSSGAIQFPEQLIPLIHNSSADGWYKFTRLKIGEDSITASFSLNLVNNPKVTIDRLTGGISIRGFGNGFSGECRKFDPATMTKKF